MTQPGATLITITGTRNASAQETPVARRGLALRACAAASLFGAYWLLFFPAHQKIGNPAFLLGLIPCIGAGALLGPRAALVVVMATTLLDSAFARALPAEPETSLTAAIFSALNKLMLGVGTGLLHESRARLRTANTQLLQEADVRKRREKSLEHNYRLHQALVDCLGEGVGLFDAGNRFLFANPALCSLLGASPAELQGRPLSQFFTVPAPSEKVETGAPRSYDVTLRANGKLLLVTETHLTQAGSNDTLTLRVMRDLSERIALERRQKELERVAERNHAFQSLAVLAGGVAHDFNNLLSGVVGNAEVGLMQLPNSAPPMLGHCLSEIKTFALEAAQLSRQMLAYAGQRSLAVEALNVNAEIHEALRLLHATIESRARLVLELEEPLLEAAADKFQLRQIVTNLVMNGLDALGAQRGTLTIRTRLEELSPERLANLRGAESLAPGKYVKLSVKDTGSGISGELRERIFEPFFSTKAPGRGMGLAAALGIARSHGGSLYIEETRAGVGTTFSLLLPVAHSGSGILTQSLRPVGGPLSPGCVLIIDDEPAVRSVTAKLLGELGQRVLVAHNGKSGLELFRAHANEVTLVMLDLTMPEESGAEVLSELTRLKTNVRVIVSSGYHSSDASALLSTPNVVGFLEKPHTLARLEALLATA